MYKRVGDVKKISKNRREFHVKPDVDWPIHSHQRLHRSEDGRPPVSGQQGNGSTTRLDAGASYWKLVNGLYEIDNLYDLGFWDNLKDVLWPM